MPYSRSPISDSPDSFNRRRRKTGSGSAGATTTSSGRTLTSAAELEPLELEDLRTLVRQRPPDLLRRVVDPFLFGQHVRTEEPLVQHPLDDPVARLLGLRLDLVRSEVDLALLHDRLFRHIVAADPARFHGSDVHRDLARELV